MTWLRLAARNVLRHRRRSAVTLAIVALGTAAILVGGGFALHTYRALRETAARESGHLVVAHRDHFARDEDVPMQHGLADHAAVRARLLARPDVRAVLPRLELFGLVSNGDKSAVFVGKGVDPGAELAARGPFLTLVAGAALSPRQAPGTDPEVLVGRELARQLRAAPGSSLTLLATTTDGALNARDVVVRGVFTTGVPDLDRRAVLVHLETAQRLLVTDKVSTLSVYLRDTALTGPAADAVRAALPDLAVRTWLDEAFYYLAVRGLYDRVFGLLGAVLVVIVLFAVSNTVGMAVLERTREIGALRAMGTLPWQIVRSFALEGLVLGAAGALAGAALALATALAVDALGIHMPPPPGRSIGYPLRLDVSLALYAGTAVAVGLASVVAALVPSLRATRLPIVEALTHV